MDASNESKQPEINSGDGYDKLYQTLQSPKPHEQVKVNDGLAGNNSSFVRGPIPNIFGKLSGISFSLTVICWLLYFNNTHSFLFGTLAGLFFLLGISMLIAKSLAKQ